MGTYHKTKFAFLMDAFEATGRELGDFLHVDYSLISKWRNNKRTLNNRNGYLDQIVHYFISLDTANGYKRIKLLLKHNSTENLDKILKHWLLESTTQGENIVTEPFSPSNKGARYNASIVLYEGNKGRRSAVLNFLNAVLEIPTTPELYLISQEDMSWLIEDPAFLHEWRELLLKVLTKGNKITIIHTVDRRYSPLVSILEHWLPLHLTGRIIPLYYPKYTDVIYKTTLFILKDHFAVTGLFVDGFSKKACTALLSDPISIMQCEWIFQEFFSNSLYLYDPYYFKDFFKLSTEIMDSNTKEENSYLRMEMPPIHLFSSKDFRTLLEEKNFEKNTIEKLLFYHQNMQKSSRQNFSLCYQRQIYSLEIFERIVKEDTAHYYELDMIYGKPLKIPLKYFCKQLQAMIDRLDQYPNYEIALTNRPLNKLDNANVMVKENIIALAYSASQPIHSFFYVCAKEPTIVNTFFKYYENLWNILPRTNKDKDWIKTKLQVLIKKAQNKKSS